jgi:hypothetical protein
MHRRQNSGGATNLPHCGTKQRQTRLILGVRERQTGLLSIVELIHIRTHCHVDPPLQKGPGVQDGAGQNVQIFSDAIAEPPAVIN